MKWTDMTDASIYPKRGCQLATAADQKQLVLMALWKVHKLKIYISRVRAVINFPTQIPGGLR